MPEQIALIAESLKQIWIDIVAFLPQLLIAIVLLVVGILVARLVRFLLLHILRYLRFDVLTTRAGIDDFLMKGGVQFSGSVVVANIIYWCFLIALTLAILNSIGIRAASNLFNQFIDFLPHLIVAIFIVVFGALAAKFVRGVTFTYLTNLKISGAQFFSILVQWGILILVFSFALSQISVGSELFIVAFEIAFAAVCFALALAFGLAGKEWATQILERLWRQSR